MMANDNLDVSNGIANGSIGRFKKLQLNHGAKLVPIQLHDYWVYSVDIEDVEWLELEWYDSKFEGRSVSDLQTQHAQWSIQLLRWE